MRDWLVVLKDGTRVKVRAAYCMCGLSAADTDIEFVDSDECPVAVFATGTVAYCIDTALCAVAVEGPPAVAMSPVWTGPVSEWLKTPLVISSSQQGAIQTPHDGGRNAP